MQLNVTKAGKLLCSLIVLVDYFSAAEESHGNYTKVEYQSLHLFSYKSATGLIAIPEIIPATRQNAYTSFVFHISSGDLLRVGFCSAAISLVGAVV